MNSNDLLTPGTTAHSTPSVYGQVDATGSPVLPLGISPEQNFNTAPAINSSFNASSLGTSGVTYPQPAPTSGLPYSVISSTVSPYEQAIRDAQGGVTSAQGSVDSGMTAIEEIMRRLGTRGTEEARLAAESGLTGKRQDYDAINLEMAGIKNSLNQGKSDTTGMTREQTQSRDTTLDRQAAFKLTDLNIRQAVMGQEIGRLETSLKNKLDLQFEPLETELKIREKWFDVNRDKLSTAEQRVFSLTQSKLAEQVSTEKENRMAINDILTKATENGIMIPDKVVQQVVSAPNAKSAFYALQRAGVSLQDPLERAQKLASIRSSNASAAKSEAELANGSGGGFFTNANLKKGSSVARTTLDEFQTYAPDVKNFYVNPPKNSDGVTLPDFVRAQVANIKSGKLDAQEFSDAVNGLALPADVKNHIISQIPAQDEITQPGFFSRLFTGVANYLK